MQVHNIGHLWNQDPVLAQSGNITLSPPSSSKASPSCSDCTEIHNPRAHPSELLYPCQGEQPVLDRIIYCVMAHPVLPPGSGPSPISHKVRLKVNNWPKISFLVGRDWKVPLPSPMWVTPQSRRALNFLALKTCYSLLDGGQF